MTVTLDPSDAADELVVLEFGCVPTADYSHDPNGWLREVTGEFAWRQQREIWASVNENKYTAVLSCNNSGKGSSLSCMLPTPNGWTTMGQVAVGDRLLDPVTGGPCTITHVSETQTNPSHRFTFSDGTHLDTWDDHQWQVIDCSVQHPKTDDRRKQWDRSVTRTTAQIAAGGVKARGRRRWLIPNTRPLDLPEADLPIDPWLLGLWLADGSKGDGWIALNNTTKVPVSEALQQVWPRARLVPSSVKDDGHSRVWSCLGLAAHLRSLGVADDKHVPPVYLRASISQRLALLRGIMDGDGFTAGEGRGASYGIDLANKRLMDGVAELIRTLGWVPRVTEAESTWTHNGEKRRGTRWRCSFTPDMDPMLHRERPAWVPPVSSRTTCRTITAIEPVEPIVGRCVQVDSPMGTYLAGEQFIPTHNTWLAARIIAWFVMEHWRQGVRVVTTAPTAAQISLMLWQELRSALAAAKANDAKVPGKIVGSPFPQWNIGEKNVAFGRHPADHQSSALQGIHAPWVLAVVDEAGGVSQMIYNSIDKIMTNRNARVLLIGNPDDKNTPFGKVTSAGSGWNVIQVDGLRTPNMTRAIVTNGEHPFLHAHMVHEGLPFNDEELPPGLEDVMRENLLDPGYVEGLYVRYCGLDPDLPSRVSFAELGQIAADAAAQSQLFTMIVRGDFPEGAGNSVIPAGWLRRAQERWADWNRGTPAWTDELAAPGRRRRAAVPPRADQPGRRIIGVDVATTNGADDTCISPRQGWVTHEVRVISAGDTHEIAHEVAKHAGANLAGAIAVVDGIGIGAGVRDALRHVVGMTAVSFEAYLQSDRRDRDSEYRFLNDRSAAWWRLRELLDPVRGVPIAIPPDPTLEAELCAPTWKIRASTKGGVIQVESKDDIRKRLKHSTDRADSVVHSYWIDNGPVQAAGDPGPEPIPWAPLADPGNERAPMPDPMDPTMTVPGGAGFVSYRLGDTYDEE